MKFNTKIKASSNLATTASLYFYTKSGKIYKRDEKNKKTNIKQMFDNKKAVLYNIQK